MYKSKRIKKILILQTLKMILISNKKSIKTRNLLSNNVKKIRNFIRLL